MNHTPIHEHRVLQKHDVRDHAPRTPMPPLTEIVLPAETNANSPYSTLHSELPREAPFLQVQLGCNHRQTLPLI